MQVQKLKSCGLGQQRHYECLLSFVALGPKDPQNIFYKIIFKKEQENRFKAKTSTAYFGAELHTQIAKKKKIQCLASSSQIHVSPVHGNYTNSVYKSC